MPRGRVVLALDLDHRARGRDQVDRQVVVGDHQVLAQDLDRVDGGRDRGVVVDLARLDQQPVLEVGEAAALADPGAAQVDRDRAAEHEVDLGQLLEGDDAAVAQRPLDRRRLAHLALRELASGRAARNGCWSRSRGTAMTSCLALLERQAAGVGLRRVGVGLDHLRRASRAGARRASAAASLAPAKLGIRPSAPGKRETPSRSIAFQTARRTWSLERIAPKHISPPGRARRSCENARRWPTSTDIPGAPRSTPPDRGRRGAALPAPRRRDAMRDLLPAIEPERRLNDWGRSERVEGVFDRTLVEFFYRYWFRVEVEGIENVPADGGALLVSNHAGALPPDAAMIAKAIREEHPNPRPLHITVEHFFKGYPGFSMLIPKIGCVAAHPANVHRLLYDERQLVLVFPEGRKGTEKLYRDRYRLRRFGRGGFVEAAMRAEAKLVPICVVGAEEAAPVFAQVDFLQAAHRAALLPDHADLPLARAARDARLPAGEVQDPLPGADRHRRARRRGGGRGQGARADASPRRSAPGSRRTSTRCSPKRKSVWLG